MTRTLFSAQIILTLISFCGLFEEVRAAEAARQTAVCFRKKCSGRIWIIFAVILHKNRVVFLCEYTNFKKVIDNRRKMKYNQIITLTLIMIRPQKLRKKAKNAGRKDVYEKQNNSVGAACFGACISSVVLRRGTRRGNRKRQNRCCNRDNGREADFGQ